MRPIIAEPASVFSTHHRTRRGVRWVILQAVAQTRASLRHLADDPKQASRGGLYGHPRREGGERRSKGA
jgi:hypothetical protein